MDFPAREAAYTEVNLFKLFTTIKLLARFIRLSIKKKNKKLRKKNIPMGICINLKKNLF